MSFIWYLIWFVVAVGLLVTVHEFGHFWVARRLGFKVLRFSVGFGRPLLRRVAGADQVEYVLAAIPLGGYVKMLDEREGPVAPAELSRSFTRRPPWQRITVLLAGPAFNILFAILVLWGMYWVGGITELQPRVGEVLPNSIAAHAGLKSGDDIRAIDGTPVTGPRDVIFGLLDAVSGRGDTTLSVRSADGALREVHFSVPDAAERRHLTEPTELFRGLGFEFWSPPDGVVGQITPNGAAARAGLEPGDRIVSIDGAPVKGFEDIVRLVSARPDSDLQLTYSRDGAQHSVRLHTSAESHLFGKAIGRIGVGVYPANMQLHTDLGPGQALGYAVHEAWSMTEIQARMFYRMVLGRVSLKNLSGPLSIAQFAGESAQAGVASFLSFLVLISLSLGFLNLLPIPILDGGQILFQLAEWLKGGPLSERAQAWGQQVGIALLIVLMGVALYNDIARQFS
jgi:regulator of sigma E protease